MKTYLFVGGPADGQRIGVNEMFDHWSILEEPKIPTVEEMETPVTAESFSFKQHTYQKETLAGNEVFVAPGMSVQDAISKMIDGYPPPDTFWMGYGFLEKLVMSLFEGPASKDYLRLTRKLSDILMEHRRKNGQ